MPKLTLLAQLYLKQLQLCLAMGVVHPLLLLALILPVTGQLALPLEPKPARSLRALPMAAMILSCPPWTEAAHTLLP